MSMDPFLAAHSEDKLRIVRTQLFPDRWRQFCKNYSLDWQYTPFERKRVQLISRNPGVYCFHVGHKLNCLPPFGLSLYGGCTESSLRNRCLNYFWEKDAAQGREHVRVFLKVFEGDLTLGWSEVDIKKFDIKTLEKHLNDALMPPYSVKDFTAKIKSARNAWQ